MNNKDIFEQMAAHYDSPDRVASANIIAAELRRHIHAAAERGTTGKSAMDYGCGTGLVGLQLSDMFESVLYVDASPQMVEQMNAKIARAGIQNANTLCSDFTVDTLPETRFDIIFMAQVLLHIRDTRLILEKLYSLLNDGGQLLIADFNKDESIVSDKVHNGFIQSELKQLMLDTGFTSAESKTFYRGERLFMGKDASMFLIAARALKQS